MNAITLLADFPSAPQRAIVTAICRYRKAEIIYICPFRRFGFSGSTLLQAYFAAAKSGVPYLIKISPFKTAEEEFAAIESMRDLVADCRLEDHKLFYWPDGPRRHRKWGALLYTNKATGGPTDADNPLALRDVLYGSTKVSITQLKRMVTQALQKLDNAHTANEPVSMYISDHYAKYFRGDVSEDRIAAVLGKSRQEPTIRFLTNSICNPILFRKSLERKSTTVNVGRVHGDLHPDNIIIDKTRAPHLIDFAWARESRDILIDFVLLENSVRFMAFPGYANLHEQFRVDMALLKEEGWREVAQMSFGTETIQKAYARLAGVVQVIRARARSVLKKRFSMEDYLLTQFIVLYGLMKYPNYNPYAATGALGLICKQLRNKW